MRLRILPRIPGRFLVRREGSITVFLALTGLLVFALLGTLVETARCRVCENHAARTLRTSAEGLLTEYSRPLYEHYGLFFLEESGTPYEQVIGKYAGDTLAASGKGDMNFLEGSLTGLEISDRVYLGDAGAAPLQEEINQYMGRIVTKEELQKFLDRSKEFADLEEEAGQIEERVEQEQELAKLDQELLELMKLIDGISVSHGKISCQKEFVKMFATRKKKGQNFGITEGAVWKEMKEHIDDSTFTWKITNKTSFLARLGRVKELTKKAISKGERLAQEYKKIGKRSTEEHDKMVEELIAGLPALNRNEEILIQTEQLLREASVKECKAELKKLWKDYDTTSLVFDYTGATEEGGGQDPKDSFGSAWDQGILQLVCETPSQLSSKAISQPDSYAQLYEEQEIFQDYGDRVSDFASEDEVSLTGLVGEIGNYGMDEFCLDQYIARQFGSYSQKKTGWKQSLDYGWEYVAAGKASDQDNLKSVLNRILLIRTVVNFMALQRDAVRKKEAYAAAAAIVGFTGLAPLITLTQTLLLLTWSLVESLVDVAALLQEREVPVIKRPSDISTNFAEIFLINRKAIVGRASKQKAQGKNSFGYKQYLLLFLMMTKQSTRRYRVMDLIQQNMKKNGYHGFQLGSCVYGMKVQANVTFPSRFFRMAPIEAALGRDIRSYQTTSEVVVGY